MSDLDDVVRVVIYDESTAIATTSFQYPLVLSTFTNFPERIREYKSAKELASDFATTDQAYIMGSKLFSQNGVLGAPPPSIYVGRRQVDSVTFTPIAADNTTYTVTVNGTPSTFTSGTTATASTIVTGLKAAIGTPVGITITGTSTLTVAPTTPGTAWSVTSSPNLTGVNAAPTESWVDALEAVEAVNDSWYLVLATTQVAAEQEAISDAVNARDKIYGLSSADAVAPTTGVTDIGYKLHAKSAARTFGVYLPTAATEYPEAAWAGSQLAVTPGANDWAYKRANGVTVARLDSTAIGNLKTKSWNYYIPKGGLNVFLMGDMFDGKPIDIQVGKDWLKARLQEGAYFRIVNSLKVAFTDPGLVTIENEIRTVMTQAQANGLIDQGWTVTTPPVSSISPTLRAQRAAGVFVIRGRLQGSVRSVDIEFYLSV